MQEYTEDIKIAGAEMSEKYDGVQGVWDGAIMRTRTGNTINTPDWWTADLPAKPLVGELWTGRGRFDEVRAIVCSKGAGDKWRDVKFLVFADIKRQPVTSRKEFDDFYNDILSRGGEGVVLTTASGEQLKRVPVSHDEGELTGFKPGSGRNADTIGSFILRLRNGRKLKVGGLNDRLREEPPEIGSIIRFTYRGFTSTGLPRHAHFDGIRAEDSLNIPEYPADEKETVKGFISGRGGARSGAGRPSGTTMPQKTKMISVRLPIEIANFLQTESKARRYSQSKIIQDALVEKYSIQEKPAKRQSY